MIADCRSSSGEVADDDDGAAVWLERLQRWGEFEVASDAGGRPLVHDRSVRNVDRTEAARTGRGAVGRRGESRYHRLE